MTKQEWDEAADAGFKACNEAVAKGDEPARRKALDDLGKLFKPGRFWSLTGRV